jgi:hypothetical protein
MPCTCLKYESPISFLFIFKPDLSVYISRGFSVEISDLEDGVFCLIQWGERIRRCNQGRQHLLREKSILVPQLGRVVDDSVDLEDL